MKISVDYVLLISLSILGIYEGLIHLHTPSFTQEPLGPNEYLLILSAILLLTVAVEIVIRNRVSENTKSLKSNEIMPFLRSPVSQIFLGLVLYAILLSYLGYLFPSFLFLIASLRIFGEKRWFRVITASIILVAFFYFIFIKIAGVPFR